MELTMILAFSILIFTSALTWVAYKLGSIEARMHASDKQSQLTLLASLWATVEAKGLARSTVIQRIVEKYHPAGAKSPEQQAAMQKKWDDFLSEIDSLDDAPRKSKHDEFMDTYDFDDEVKKDVDPADLV